jgi:chitinase
MDKVQQYTDYINVMSYDYAAGTDSFSSHHTNNMFHQEIPASTLHRSIQAFLAVGVPPSKIVIGVLW